MIIFRSVSPPVSPPVQQLSFAQKILFGLVFIVAIAFAVVRLQSYWFFTYDDTFIVLRYAFNAMHHGVVEWNVGDAVEGYTSPLHLALIILAGSFGGDLLVITQSINTAAWIGAMGGIYFIMRPLLGNILALAPVTLIMINAPMIAWIWGGLEPTFLVFMLMIGQGLMLHAFLNPARRTTNYAILTGIVFALIALTRLDAA